MDKKNVQWFFHRFYDNITNSLQGFIKDDCFTKASSLTFYTLLSIVPILAVAFGIAKGFGFEEYLQTTVETHIEQPEVAEKLISFSQNSLAEANGGVIASAGLLILLWTSLQLLSKVESSLNEIWEVKSQRSYGRQFSDYLAIIICCPIFFVLSSSLSIYAIAQVVRMTDQIAIVKAISPYLLTLIKLVPFLLNWILFSLIYIVLPNTAIRWRYAILGGIIAGTLYQLIGWIYFHFQIGVSNYSAVYGSLAALPLFLVWVNVSWQVVLFGAEIAYHVEISSGNSEGSKQMITKKQLGLAICAYYCSMFLQGKTPPSIQHFAQQLGANQRIVKSIATELFDDGILAIDQSGGFLPAKNPADMSMKLIFDAFEEKTIKYTILSDSIYYDEYQKVLQQLDDAVLHHDKNLTLQELAEKCIASS